MPRSLYGRAALILFLPVVTLQLVVSIAFIQRYYSQITEQMATSIILELDLLDQTFANDPATAGTLAQKFQMRLEPAPVSAPKADHIDRLDLSGNALANALHAGVPNLRAVDLSDPVRVTLYIYHPGGDYKVSFDRRRTTARNPHQLLVILGATGLMMSLVAFLFLRNQLRPIRRLAAAAEEFGKGRSVPVRISGATEVRAAGAAFLDMRTRIERQIEQRTLMLSGVSHDLRTPLTRLKLGLAMLGESDEIDALGRDVDDMRRMIDGFLAFARADAMDEQAQRIDPTDLARQAVENAQRLGANVTLGQVEGQGEVVCRIMAIQRALENLIGNAVTYGSCASVSVTILEKSVRFTVEDDGPGIPKEDRDGAMKPFTRLEPARNQNKGTGVGLGLAITADIARSHGGSLRLGESQALGGLCADLLLPR